uniref:non-specific serine/threonine protein kinase n=1 Tax=Strongyloides papillosus TaxID=174720 RepID=A0A0N5BII2_STREA
MLESVETLFKSLSYLSRFHIVHGDLKSTNILVQQLSPSHTKKLVLHDFGLAAHPGQFETTSTFYGPLRYASLDVHNNLRTQRADIFMVMYNLLDWLNLCPWCSDDSIEVVKNKKENFQMNISQFLSKQSCDENLVKYFENVFQILLSLDYKETPNYSLLSELTKKHALYYNNIFTKHENNVLNVQSIPTKFEILEIDSPKKPSNITIISTTIDPISMKNLYQQLSTNFEVVLAISSFCVNSCSSGFVLVYKLHNIPFFKKPIVTSQAITKYFSKSLSECNLITEGILYGLKLLKKEFKKFFIVFNNTVLYDMLNNFKNYGTCESIYNMELTKEFEGTECTIYSTSDKYLTELSTAEAMASNVNLRK